MTSLYKELDEAPDDVNTQISSGTIEMLYALVVDFVADAIPRAIGSSELEHELKSHTKVWRLGEKQASVSHSIQGFRVFFEIGIVVSVINCILQITIANMEHALETMGVSHLNKKEPFATLLQRFERVNAREGTEWNVPGGSGLVKGKGREEVRENDEDDDDDEGEEEDKDEGREPLILKSTLHRQMYPPFVRLSDARPASSVTNDQVLISAETNEDELLGELLEEEDLDLKDLQVAGVYERKLLEEFGRLGEIVEGSEADMEGNAMPVDENEDRGGQHEEGARDGEGQHEQDKDEGHVQGNQERWPEEGGKKATNQVTGGIKRKRKEVRGNGKESDRGERSMERKKLKGAGMFRKPDGVKVKSAVYIVDSEDDDG